MSHTWLTPDVLATDDVSWRGVSECDMVRHSVQRMGDGRVAVTLMLCLGPPTLGLYTDLETHGSPCIVWTRNVRDPNQAVALQARAAELLSRALGVPTTVGQHIVHLGVLPDARSVALPALTPVENNVWAIANELFVVWEAATPGVSFSAQTVAHLDISRCVFELVLRRLDVRPFMLACEQSACEFDALAAADTQLCDALRCCALGLSDAQYWLLPHPHAARDADLVMLLSE